MKREAVTLALRVALLVTLLGVIPAQASTQISSCPYVISLPHAYG